MSLELFENDEDGEEDEDEEEEEDAEGMEGSLEGEARPVPTCQVIQQKSAGKARKT